MHHHQWYSRQQPLYRQRYPFTIGISLSNTRETRAAAEATQAGSSSCRDSERAFYLTLRSSSSSRHTVGYGKFKKIICQTWSSEWFLATKTNFQLPNLIRTMTQIDSKSALEESQLCIAIAGCNGYTDLGFFKCTFWINLKLCDSSLFDCNSQSNYLY